MMRLESEPITSVQGLDFLMKAARKLNDGDPIDVVLDEVAAAAAGAVWRPAGRRGTATVWRLRGSQLNLEAEFGGTTPAYEPGLPMEGGLREVLERRRPDLLRRAEAPTGLRSRYEAGGWQQVAVAPVVSYGKPFGLVTVPLEEDTPDSGADLNLLAGVAELGGLALAAAADFELELRLAVAFELLPQMIAGASGAEDSEEAANVIVHRVAEVPGIDRVLLFMKEGEKRGLWIKASTQSVNLLLLEQDGGAVARAVAERRIVVLDLDEAEGSEQDRLIAGDNPHLLAVPVAVGTDVIGLFVMASRLRPYSASDVQMATVMVSALTGLLEGVRLRDELTEAKRTLRSFYHGLACGAVTHDSRGRLTDANWAAENLTGMPLKRMMKEGIFGPDWTMHGENGMAIPPPLRPPESVLKSGRPVQGLRAQVTAPGGQPRWLRIDSRAIEEGSRLKSVVTTFFESPPPVLSGRRRPGTGGRRTTGAGTDQ
jgi:PAS domain-containing protein